MLGSAKVHVILADALTHHVCLLASSADMRVISSGRTRHLCSLHVTAAAMQAMLDSGVQCQATQHVQKVTA